MLFFGSSNLFFPIRWIAIILRPSKVSAAMRGVRVRGFPLQVHALLIAFEINLLRHQQPALLMVQRTQTAILARSNAFASDFIHPAKPVKNPIETRHLMCTLSSKWYRNSYSTSSGNKNINRKCSPMSKASIECVSSYEVADSGKFPSAAHPLLMDCAGKMICHSFNGFMLMASTLPFHTDIFIIIALLFGRCLPARKSSVHVRVAPLPPFFCFTVYR